ncbi:MAG: hypothetical protein D6692_04295 [Planctomycetota bacterium]|nr:MAG: hypothetical protein D6692_04295 [Planctomycetota bacterium]
MNATVSLVSMMTDSDTGRSPSSRYTALALAASISDSSVRSASPTPSSRRRATSGVICTTGASNFGALPPSPGRPRRVDSTDSRISARSSFAPGGATMSTAAAPRRISALALCVICAWCEKPSLSHSELPSLSIGSYFRHSAILPSNLVFGSNPMNPPGPDTIA